MRQFLKSPLTGYTQPVAGVDRALAMHRRGLFSRGTEILLWRCNDGGKWRVVAVYDDAEVALLAISDWIAYLKAQEHAAL